MAYDGSQYETQDHANSRDLPQQEWEKGVLGFLEEALEEGEAFLKAQVGYERITQSIDMIMGKQRDLKPSMLSSTSYPHGSKCAADLAALMTDTRPFWEYRTSNPRYSQAQVNMGKLATHWYCSRHQDMRLSDVIKYAIVGGSSYAHIDWNPDLPMDGDLEMTGEDPRDVIPVRPNGNESIQNALGVMIRRGRTVNYLKARYPLKAHLIVPDADSSSVTLSLNSTRAGRILEALGGSPFLDRLWGRKAASEMARVPTATVYVLYLRDRSRNKTGSTILMGDWEKGEDGKDHALNNYSYEVKPGELKYPRGRRVIATRTAVLKDGPNPFWHGMFPCPKLTLDPWPWSFLGKGAIWDLLSMQRSLDRDMRIVDDHLEKCARPDVIADKNSVPFQQLQKIDTRRPGGKFQHNPIAGKGMQIVYPQPLDATVQWHIELLKNGMNDLSGVAALQSVMQLAQMPSADTVDKIIASMSPAVRSRSRVLESFVSEIATIMAYNFAQFYTLPMRLMILGPSGITREDHDFDPGTMIPDFIHADDMGPRGMPTAEALARGPRPKYERAQEFMKQFTFHVAPGSMLSASDMEDQLKYLQLARAGLIDHWTLLEKLNVPNVGPPADLPSDITGRLLYEQKMGLGMAISATGRKASGQAPPRQVTKES